jgi:hypothetical protein
MEDDAASRRRDDPSADREPRWLRRQLAVAGWVLGPVGGPLPVIAMLLVVRPIGATRRHLVRAAVVWTAAAIVAGALLWMGAQDELPHFAVWWIAYLSVTAVVAALGVRSVVADEELRGSDRP